MFLSVEGIAVVSYLFEKIVVFLRKCFSIPRVNGSGGGGHHHRAIHRRGICHILEFSLLSFLHTFTRVRVFFFVQD